MSTTHVSWHPWLSGYSCGVLVMSHDNDNTFIEHKYRLQMKIYI